MPLPPDGDRLSPEPVLALDLGGTRLRAAVVAEGGRIVARDEAPTDADRGQDAVIETAVALLEHVRTSAAAAGPVAGGVLGLGISSIGPLDPWRGRIIEPPNARALRGMPIAPELARRLMVPAFLEHDTNVALLGEMAFGAARDVADVVYLTVSTGIGGAILTGGFLVRGPDGTAGELGHMLVELEGPACGCGSRGCLEAISSGSGIARAAREAIAERRSAMLATVAERVGIERISAADVAAAEDAGDEAAAGIMEHARAAFAAAMVSVTNVFNPTLIVVGGSVARAQGERWLGPAREAVATRAYRTPAARVSIVPAALGDDVGLVGCLPLVRRRLAEA